MKEQFGVFKWVRLPEWYNSCVLILFGFQLLANPEIINSPSYSGFVLMRFNNVVLGSLLILVGLVRGIALYINGRWNPTPIIRAIGAAIGAQLFMSITVSFILSPPNTGWPTYLIFVISEFVAITIAVAEYRKRS